MLRNRREDALRRWLAALLAALALLACAPAGAQQRLTLNFVNTDIEAVARAMSDFTGRTFIVDPRVKGTVTLAIEQPLTPDEAIGALSSALRLQGIAMIVAGGTVRIVPEVDAKLQGGQVILGAPGAGARGDELVTQVFRLNYESAAQIAQVLRPLIASNNPITAHAANNTIVVTDYAENIRRIARIIAAIDTPAGSEIDVVRLQHAIATDLAALLARMLEPSPQAAGDASQRVTILAEPSSNSLLIRAPTAARAKLVRTLIEKLDQPSASPGNIHVVFLKNANAAVLARTLLGVAPADAPAQTTPGAQSPTAPGATQGQPVGQQARTGLGTGFGAQRSAAPGQPGAPVSGSIGGAQIQADPATNTLIIIAPDAVYRNLRAVIDQLDTRRAQVFIESLIVEVTSEQAAEFGIQWQGGLGRVQQNQQAVLGGTNFGGTGQNIFGIAQNPATAGTGLNIGFARGTITLPGVGEIINLQFLARALERNNNANILSTPNILTLDNEEARITVGQNVPFITGQFVTQGSAANVNPFQTIERRDVGLTLRVRPQISEAGTIRLVIYQEVSSVQDRSDPAGIITNMRAIETNVLVDDGSIVVLGGLIQDTVNNTKEKVPLLGDLPLIGWLFRFETRRQEKTNLMVFLRPFIVRDDAGIRGVTLDRYERMRTLGEGTRSDPSWVLPNLPPPELPPATPQ